MLYIGSISPSSGPVAGGNTVTITGTGFTGVTSVLFDDTPGQNLVVQNDGSLTVTAPPGDPGLFDITLTFADSSQDGTRGSSYTYLDGDTPVAGQAAQDEEGGTAQLTAADGTGKYFQLMVPDFRNASSATMDYASSASGALNSYLRLGAPRFDLASITDGDVPPYAVAYGEDLAHYAKTGDPDLHTLGGIRDHTDGHRISTTRGSVMEVIQGQLRTLVLGGLPIFDTNELLDDDDDPQWQPSPGMLSQQSDANDVEANVVEHLYGNTYYETIATTTFAGVDGGSSSYPAPYAEVRRTHGSLGPGEIYEYLNGTTISEILAATDKVYEATYADKVVELTTTVHHAHPDWEPDTSNLSSGDVYDYLLAGNVYEVVRASGDYNDTLQADGALTERVLGFDITEETIAQGGIDEITVAKGGINEITSAIAIVNEVTLAAFVTEFTIGAIGVVDVLAAGGALFDILAAGGWLYEALVSLGRVSEYTRGSRIVSTYRAVTMDERYDVETTNTWKNNGFEWHQESTEVAERKQVNASSVVIDTAGSPESTARIMAAIEEMMAGVNARPVP